jgi:hypothetical protein
MTTSCLKIRWVTKLAEAVREGGLPLAAIDTSYMTPFEHEQFVIEAGTELEREAFCRSRGWPAYSLKF